MVNLFQDKTDSNLMKMKIIILTHLVLISNLGLGQIVMDSILRLPKAENQVLQKNVVYHDLKSKLPDTIHIEGIIMDITLGYCGVYCIGGTISVKPEKQIEGYSASFVYLVTACMKPSVKIGTKINTLATKLTREDKECYYKSVLNSINSGGVPFYKLSEKETNKIE